MNEKRSKRREWVKTAAIIFLSVLLVLTFFSNRSLPEVATKYVQSGTITSKIRGGGAVESGDPYTIEVPSIYVGRKVTGISVRTGDKVQKGDVLFTLADGDGEELQFAKNELTEAQESLKRAQDAYDDAILKAGITSSDINSAKSNPSASSYRKMITDKQAQLQEAKDKLKPLQNKIDELEQLIADCNEQIAYENNQNSLASSRLSLAQTALTQAQNEQTAAAADMTAAQTAKSAIESESEALEAAYLADPDSIEDIDASRADIATRLAAADATLTEKKTALDKARAALEKANKEVDEANKAQASRDVNPVINNLNKLIADYTLSKYGQEKQKKEVQAEVDKIDAELNELVSKIGDVSMLQTLQDDITKARKTVAEKEKKVEELSGENSGSEVLADIAGTITSINVSSGKKIETRDVVIMQPEGQGYFMSFSVTNEQARMVSVGDKANLVNSWYYNNMDITLQSIKPDKQEPSKKKMLTFAIDGEVTVGQNINVSVGQKSQNYDYIIPASALRNDNNGDYVLVVESKSTPLGNRYIATRVDVQVLAKDDTQVAVNGAFNGWGMDYVITTASAPIEAGAQVRMADN